MITFRLEEEDTDALCYVAIEAKVVSRELYDGYYAQFERNAKHSAA